MWSRSCHARFFIMALLCNWIPGSCNAASMVPHKGPRQPIMGQVRVLTLSYGQDGSSTLYRLSQGWTLRFELGPSLMGKKVTLWTTYPVSETDGGNPASPSFNRPSHHQVPWQRASPNLEDDTALYAGIPLSTSGAFHFCIKEDGRQGQKIPFTTYLIDEE